MQARRVALGSRLFVWAIPGLVLAWLAPSPLRASAVLLFDVVLVLGFWLDARRLLRCPVDAQRALPTRLCVDHAIDVELRLASAASTDLTLTVRDVIPPGAAATPNVQRTLLPAHGERRLSYRLLPRVRGKQAFGDVHLRLQSRLGLAAVDLTITQPLTVRVLPASFAVRRTGQPGPREDVGEVRARLLRSLATGGELESLRPYVAGDALRSIDWKATSRLRHPVTRVFQPERSQTVWLVLDASRTMGSTLREADAGGLGARTRFDLALEVALDLAQRALAVGDQVGALVYADRRVKLVAPGRGRAHERALIEALTDAVPDSVQLDVRGLVAELERAARKRSLLVLLTDLENEAHGELLTEHAPLLTRKHLVLLVSLDDAVTLALAIADPTSEAAAYLQAAAADQLHERASLRARLLKRGLRVVEASEARLFPSALDRYLEIKLSQRL